MKKIDISSREDEDEASKKLSNFNEYHFYFDGVFCASMEGLLQSFKFEDHEKQIEVCSFLGGKAKRAGKKQNWYKDQKLYWKNVIYERSSLAYQDLLDRAFSALYTNEEFSKVLNGTKGKLLDHSMGKTDLTLTILTIDEFCSRLHKLRDY